MCPVGLVYQSTQEHLQGPSVLWCLGAREVLVVLAPVYHFRLYHLHLVNLLDQQGPLSPVDLLVPLAHDLPFVLVDHEVPVGQFPLCFLVFHLVQVIREEQHFLSVLLHR